MKKKHLLWPWKSAEDTSELLDGRGSSMYNIFLSWATKLNKQIYLRHFNHFNIITFLFDTPYDHYVNSCTDRIADKTDDTDDRHS